MSRARRLLFGCLVSLSLAAPAAEPTATQQARAKVQLTVAAFGRDGDVIAAQKGFREALKLDPSLPEALFNLGKLAEGAESWDEAKKLFERCAASGAGTALGQRAAEELPRLDKLRKTLATPAGKKQVEYERGLARARVLLDAGELGAAVVEAGGASKLDPSRHEAYALAAAALTKEGAYAEACPWIEKALARAPAIAKGRLRSALSECKAQVGFAQQIETGQQALTGGDYARAAQAFQGAFKALPAREDAGLRAAAAIALAGDGQQATALYRKLAASNLPEVRSRATAELERLKLLGEQRTVLQADVSSAEAGRAHFDRQTDAADGSNGSAGSRAQTDPRQRFRGGLKKFSQVGLYPVVRANRLLIQLPGALLFQPGDAHLNDAARQMLRAVAEIIRGDSEISQWTFQVAGHTDNQPVKGDPFKDKWGISVMRARAVVAFLTAPLDSQGGGLDAQHWSAAGYADTDPVASNDSAEGRTQNRRVELVVMPNVGDLLGLP